MEVLIRELNEHHRVVPKSPNDMSEFDIAERPEIQKLRKRNPKFWDRFLKAIGHVHNEQVQDVKELCQRYLQDLPNYEHQQDIEKEREAGQARRDIVKALKHQLPKQKLGRFTTGRKGKPSRFTWMLQASGDGRQSAAESDDRDLSNEPAQTSVHSRSGLEREQPRRNRINFFLRTDFCVNLELPADLTELEAQKLNQVISHLVISPA